MWHCFYTPQSWGKGSSSSLIGCMVVANSGPLREERALSSLIGCLVVCLIANSGPLREERALPLPERRGHSPRQFWPSQIQCNVILMWLSLNCESDA
jgi:hypothetical protein